MGKYPREQISLTVLCQDENDIYNSIFQNAELNNAFKNEWLEHRIQRSYNSHLRWCVRLLLSPLKFKVSCQSLTFLLYSDNCRIWISVLKSFAIWLFFFKQTTSHPDVLPPQLHAPQKNGVQTDMDAVGTDSEVTVWTFRETELKIDHNHAKIMDLGGCWAISSCHRAVMSHMATSAPRRPGRGRTAQTHSKHTQSYHQLQLYTV